MFKKIITLFVGSGELRANLILEIARKFAKDGRPVISKLFLHYLHREYGCYIHQDAIIGDGFKMIHPTGIVVGAKTIIGKDVHVYQQVTIGTAREGDFEKSNYPTIGDRTVVYAGAKILGNIKIGADCIIGANAVVTKDVPENSVAVGIPSRSYKRKN